MSHTMRSVDWIFNLKLATRDMNLKWFWGYKSYFDLNRQYELDKGTQNHKNPRYIPICSCTSVNKNVGNWHEVALNSVSCRYRHMLESRELKRLILRRDRLLWADGVPIPLVFLLWDMIWEIFAFWWSGRGIYAHGL
jgi:hypothetical protein